MLYFYYYSVEHARALSTIVFHRSRFLRGVARIFQRGGHTVSNIIAMAFSPRNIIGFLLKKGLQRGGGHGHPRTPLATPLFLMSPGSSLFSAPVSAARMFISLFAGLPRDLRPCLGSHNITLFTTSFLLL